ncbi:MAG: hypothetical protein WBL40_18710 [Terrimicrobiaceae bacterium]
MPQRETCGNEYDKAMQITGKSHWFDSCDFAIHALASSCAYCRCTVIGRCAKEQGLRELDDRK